MNTRFLNILIILLWFALGIPPALAAGTSLPCEFYGSVSINELPAPAGILIEARIDGQSVGSLTTTNAGTYGGNGTFDKRITVDKANVGQTITFFVAGVEANQTATYQPGVVSRLDLTILTEAGTESVNLSSTTAPTPTRTAVAPPSDDYIYFYTPPPTTGPVTATTVPVPVTTTPATNLAPTETEVTAPPTVTAEITAMATESPVATTAPPVTTEIPTTRQEPPVTQSPGFSAGLCLAGLGAVMLRGFLQR